MAHSCPSAERWKEHLDGTLPAEEQALLAEHLEGCAACRKTLERLAGGGDSLLDVARHAGERTEEATPELDEVVAQFQAPASETQADPSARRDDSLAFLAPSDKPGVQGRLGHYEVQEIIGRGGFGTVLKAFDERLHRVVAIKVLAPAYAAQGAARARFIREARAIAPIKNEHVVGIHDVQGEADPPYLVMELIDGISLQDKLDKHGALGVKEILRIGMQIAEGLAAAHKQGLVHRDIKPANILLENGVERVKITDFGLARAVDDASVTQSGTVAGTPMYMSPEQAEGLAIDHRSDLFSLGSVLYAMCAGHPPFRASGTHAVLKRVIDAAPRPVREVNSEIPGWLCDIVNKLHAKKPADRFQTAHEVAESLGARLAEVQAGRAVGAGSASDGLEISKPGGAELSASPRSRRWAVVVPMLAGVVVIAIVAGRRYWKTSSHPDAPSKGAPAFVPVFGGFGWRSLYDGKGYAGWKAFGDSNAGAGEILLFARGQVETSDPLPRNFHLRAEVNLLRGRGTIRFHAKAGAEKFDHPFPTDGCFLNLTENPHAKGLLETELVSVAPGAGVSVQAKGATEFKLGDWLYLELVATDEHATVRINGQEVVSLKHLWATPGVLRLWNNGFGDDRIAFRNIEIKDITPPKPAPVEPSDELRRLAIAMHAYHDTHERFPTPANYDKKGTPLLSWRVHLLPFLGQEDLYRQFKLDEPWDSPHNRELVAKIPAVFSLGRTDGKTTLLVPVGAETIFPGGKGVNLLEITRGASNTVLILQADDDHRVIWSKPDDWPYNPYQPAQGLGENFWVARPDGAVFRLSSKMPTSTLRQILTRAGDVPPQEVWRKAPEARKAPPGEVGLRLRRGWELVEEGPPHYDEARKEFAAALGLEPENAEAHAGAGYVHASQKNHKDAERHAALAILHGAGDYIVLHNVACVYAMCGVADPKQETRYQDMALDQLRRAVALWSKTKMGPNELDLIRREGAFPRSMRDRADFKALIHD
ncbi:MAG: protein kinase [Gemmataceae bacterium]